MSKTITLLSTPETPVTVEVGASVSREQLYGRQERSVEKDGTALEKVIITPWGEILPDRSAKSEQVDSEGSIVGKTIECDETGEPLPVHPSSFKEPRPITPAEWHELACLKTEKVMPVTADLPPGLWKTNFCYRDSANLEDAFLLVKDDGAFLITGDLKEVPFAGLEETYQFFEADEEESEEDDDGFDSL